MEGVGRRLADGLVGVVLLAHASIAAAWVWALPHGFPWLHPRTLANEVAPLSVLALALLAGHARRERPGRTALVTAGLAGSWLGALVGLVATFPITGPRAAPIAVAGLVATGLAAALAVRTAPGSRRALAACALAGVALGAALPWTQRGPEPDTRPHLPAGEPLPPPFDRWPPGELASIASGTPSPASSGALVADAYGRLELDLAGGARLRLEPLLVASSRSPDRGWTLFSTPAERAGPWRSLVAARDTPGLLVDATFASEDGPAALRARGRADGGLEVDAVVGLERPVFAHLCTFARVVLEGVDAPRVAFGALPAIDVVESDYPVGRPARLSCFTGDRLRVLEATSGEKGPFTELAAAPLARGEPLVVTLHDGPTPLVRLTFLDVTAQAGLARSPTAGWGLPVNAIELQRRARSCWLFLTLAATSVGRGFDSVGHAPGVYRDRIVVEPLR